MFKTGINFNDQNFASDQADYFSFSSKYKAYCKKLVGPQNSASFVTFLSGPAGTGKTSTLQAEFITPLRAANILHYHFNFIPDKVLHNHFFLRLIARYLLSEVQKDERKAYPSFMITELEKFIAYYERFEKEEPFNASEVNRRFVNLLLLFTQENRLVLVFEDIHLAKANFYDFLEQIERAQNKISLKVICTTRLNKASHNISLGLSQRWFYLNCISEKDMARYLNFLSEKEPAQVEVSKNIYAESGGNPFYIKEFFQFNRQKNDCSSTIKFHAPFQSSNSDGKGVITSFRFHSLTKNSQAALKLLCLLGYYVEQTEAIQVLFDCRIKDVSAVIKSLKNAGFITNLGDTLCFQHHLYYECVKSDISTDESQKLHKVIFDFLYKKRSTISNERLIHHASQADLKAYTCVFAKKFASELHKAGHYGPAAHYYNIYLESINACSSPQKLSQRTIQALLPLHAISFILGDNTTEERIFNYLLGFTSDSDPLTRYNIDATLTVSYWTTGRIQKAHQFAKRNVQNALEINDRRLIIAAKARYASLSSEVADFKTAMAVYNELLSLIAPHERHDKFDMLVEAYAVIEAVGSICNYEAGNFLLSREQAERAYKIFDESIDDFTCLHISAHAGYTMIMQGKYHKAFPYLERGLKMGAKSKTKLISAPALGLLGLCYFYTGDSETGRQKIQESLSLMEKTFKGSKKGIINLAWMESLLLGFRTEEFSENIDRVIDEVREMSQFSHLGWLYFLKAVHHAFYQSSIQGFVGAYTKAAMIAKNFDMKALQLNLLSLSNLESSRILATEQDEPFPSGFFDKARYFYDHTQNVKPISFHIQNRTRS